MEKIEVTKLTFDRLLDCYGVVFSRNKSYENKLSEILYNACGYIDTKCEAFYKRASMDLAFLYVYCDTEYKAKAVKKLIRKVNEFYRELAK